MSIKLMTSHSMSLNHAYDTGYWAWTITTVITLIGGITYYKMYEATIFEDYLLPSFICQSNMVNHFLLAFLKVRLKNLTQTSLIFSKAY